MLQINFWQVYKQEKFLWKVLQESYTVEYWKKARNVNSFLINGKLAKLTHEGVKTKH